MEKKPNWGKALAEMAEECVKLRAQLLAAESERDEARRSNDYQASSIDRYRDESQRQRAALEFAERAALEYHEAWQDAAVYWKDKVVALAAERDEARRVAQGLHRQWHRRGEELVDE